MQLISAPDYARRLGINGKEQIRNNFLITRHMKDYLLFFLSLFKQRDVVYFWANISPSPLFQRGVKGVT
jgi:trehalose synthase